MRAEQPHTHPVSHSRPKPLLRGWSHALAAVITVPVTIVLCWNCLPDIPRLISVAVFGLSMLGLFTISAIYHMGHWRPVWRRFWHAFDHANIFLVIAGTYTPVCFNVLDGWTRPASLITIWVLAISGIIISIFLANRIPRGIKVGYYAGLGWLSMLILPAVLAALPLVAVGTMMLGGLAYTFGGLVYGLRRPNPFPNVFGFHEIFHLFVIAGGALFALSIWLWILPFPRA